MKIAGKKLEDIDSKELRSLRKRIEGRGIDFSDYITKFFEDRLWDYESVWHTTSSEDELRRKARRK